ncbi:uncharacterized protein LOC127276601 [Leptopilina boulardi]|uniref:uncharacterized protein LOC127276601 n=1 Tax=Leptopilina boulardi TaxID=63433 RepID=UPI0021F55881|nr:uncharacterized protein LOC127276601 [Leptopilina boulardi]
MRFMLMLFLLVLVTLALGLRKVPKVYNALITTDQNLLPSRAFPVLQPVIHKTTVGYVPPYYYTQIAPQFTPEFVQISQGIAQGNSAHQEAGKKIPNSSKTENNRKEDNQQIPLRFYPNYHSFYYDPYFYTYNGYDSHLAPSAYQENGSVEPLPPQNFQNLPQHLLPSLHDEKNMMRNIYHEKKKDIPDVPPPPVPTKVTKSS